MLLNITTHTALNSIDTIHRRFTDSTICTISNTLCYSNGGNMHIPDNYLSPSTCAVMGSAMLPIWAVAVSKVKKMVSAKQIPLLGISAAFSFLVMMLNIPLPGGTTGHAVGSVLIAILLGPSAACLSVSVALLIQALFFGDGGILAFGANCFNMAFIMPYTGYMIFTLLSRLVKSDKSKYIIIFISAYAALNIAAFFAAVEFGIQPLLFKDAAGLPLYSPYGLSIAIPAMTIPHLLVAGVAEGLITAGVFAFVAKTSPGIIENREDRTYPLYLLLLAMIVITPIGLLAPGTAWSEWGAEEIGALVNFIPQGMRDGFSFKIMMPDYTFPIIKNETTGYVISAIIGSAILVIVFKIVSEILKRRKKDA